jgi:hypothetical protein
LNGLFLSRINPVNMPHVAANLLNRVFLNGIDVPTLPLTSSSMFDIFTFFAVSLDIPKNVSIIFINGHVHLTDATGTVRTVSSGFFPTATSLKIPDADAWNWPGKLSSGRYRGQKWNRNRCRNRQFDGQRDLHSQFFREGQ